MLFKIETYIEMFLPADICQVKHFDKQKNNQYTLLNLKKRETTNVSKRRKPDQKSSLQPKSYTSN